jgi:hypothetical protein
LRYAAAQLTSGFHIANMPSTEHNQPAQGANDFLVRIVSVLISSLLRLGDRLGNSLKDRNVSRSEAGARWVRWVRWRAPPEAQQWTRGFQGWNSPAELGCQIQTWSDQNGSSPYRFPAGV